MFRDFDDGLCVPFTADAVQDRAGAPPGSSPEEGLEQSRSSTDAEISLEQRFLAFCRSKPADEQYLFGDSCNCPVTQFGRHAGLIGVQETLYRHEGLTRMHEWPFPEVLLEYPKTFGALADRLAKMAV